MSRQRNPFDENSLINTPKPFATSTEERKQFKFKRNENVINSSNTTSDSDESLGVLSINSEDFGPYIDKLQLKDSKKNNTESFVKEQRELATKTLQNRESKDFGLPSRLLRPSEISTPDSSMSFESGSTINESDLLRQSKMNDTSIPRSSISSQPDLKKLDIAEAMAKLSLEIRNPNMSLSTALQKMEEEYHKYRDSISIQSDMFKPAEEAETQLLADEASWKRERDLPTENVEFTMDNLDASKFSISTFFRQRCEDISDVIPSSTRKCSMASDISRIPLNSSRKQSLASNPSSISSVPEESLYEIENTPRKDSLSITKIAQILQNSEETPNKVLDYLLKQCSGGYTEDVKESSMSLNPSVNKDSTLQRFHSPSTDEDHGNYLQSSFSCNKENFNSLNTPQESNLNKMSQHSSKSLTSLRSTSSLSNLPGGKLPIETTHCELVWGCVKAGKSEIKQFTLRNRSSNRLRVQCSISGPVFRMMQERAEESSNSIILKLHPHETKSISVIFNPLTDGAAVDEILFSPCDSNLQQTKRQSIKLFGYGGLGSIEFKNNVLKDSLGRYCLSLGNIFGQLTISGTITVFNKGSLPCFAIFDYVPKNFALSKISIIPSVFILPPNEQRDIFISFKANRGDIKYLENCMVTSTFEIGTIKLISGPEATRGRIKKICKVAMERNLELDVLCSRLQQGIEGEDIPSDVVKCRESVNSIKPLLQGLVQKEIIIMLERDMDTTLVNSLADETSKFQSLIQESTITENPVSSACKLEPASLILTIPSKMQDWIFIISESAVPLCFKIDAPDGIEVKPSFGSINPHSTRPIKLKIHKLEDIAQSIFSVSVNVGDEILYTTVKIISI